MNLCVNAIKRIRSLPGTTKDQTGDPMESAKPTVKSLSTSYSNIAAQMASSIAPSKKVIRPSSIGVAKLEKKHSSLLANQGQLLVKKRGCSLDGIPELTGELVIYFKGRNFRGRNFREICEYLAKSRKFTPGKIFKEAIRESLFSRKKFYFFPHNFF